MTVWACQNVLYFNGLQIFAELELKVKCERPKVDMTDWYGEIFQALMKARVRFVVAGGVALNLLGVPRFTADIDLIIALSRENVFRFVKCLARLGYKTKLPVKAESFADEKTRKKWIEEKNMMVFSFYKKDHPYELVDVFMKEPMPFDKMWRERKRVRLGNIFIPVISVDHLIFLKKKANRLQDISDVESLKRLKAELKNEKTKGKRR